MVKTIVVRASELAAVAGKHPFRPQPEEIRRIRAQLFGGAQAEKHEQASQKLANYTTEAVLHTAKVLGVADRERTKLANAVTATETATRAVTTARLATKAANERVETAKRALDSQKRDMHTSASIRAAESAAQTARLDESSARKQLRVQRQRQAQTETSVLPEIKASVVRDIDKRCISAAKEIRSASDVRELASLPVPAVVEQHDRMAKGTVQEASILELAKHKFVLLETARPTAAAAPLVLGEFESEGREFVVKLVGTCDAINDDFVVEIKNRKSRLFHRLAEYESVQLQAYLQLYRRERGVLIEHFCSDLAEHWCERDAEAWSAIVRATLSAVRDAVVTKNP